MNLNNNRYKSKVRNIVLIFIPIIIMFLMISLLFSPFAQPLFNLGIVLPKINIEKVEFHENVIFAFVRNIGQNTINISQVDINDRIHPAIIEPDKSLQRFEESKIVIPFSWNKGEPYEIGITTEDGTRFNKIVEAAVETPQMGISQVGLYALIGTYVGVIPIFAGLLWYPIVRGLDKNKYNFIMSITLGLLFFLAIDAMIESNELAVENFSEPARIQLLIIITTVTSVLVLIFISNKIIKKKNNDNDNDRDYKTHELTKSTGSIELESKYINPFSLSLMIAIGIGLHNFGEGLIIGSSILLGKLAFTTFLIIGFTIHNTTEGLAIVSPLSRTKSRNVKKLIIYGLIAGIPTIGGTFVGGFSFSNLTAILFLTIGAAAIFQVIYHLTSDLINKNKDVLSNGYIIIGFIIGVVLMYVTGIFI